MKQIAKRKTSIFVIYCLLAAASALAAYDPTWTKTQCGTYSYNGLKERYVYGSNRGWINNNVWDDPAVEGVDCASYVCRALALPEYVPESTAAPYPYTTTKLIAGVPNMTEVASINNLQQWDVWVYVTSTSKHTGLFKEYSGSYIITREARSETSGVVEGKFSKQSLVDRGTRYWRRSNWAVQSQIPTVQTLAATSISSASAKLNAAITNTGSETITSAGFAWGTTSACSSGWIAAVPASDNSFSATLTGLNPSTTYYFRAQAQNRIGWGSGSVLSFKTTAATDSSVFIIDNGQAGTSSTGTWSVSGATGSYGTNSLWARDGATYSWSSPSLTAGNYEVFMWWTEFSSRSTAAPVQVYHANGRADLSVNQQLNGGQWNSLGVFYFSGTGKITLLAPGAYPTSYSADAVKFVKTASLPADTDTTNPATEVITVDNSTAGTSSVGTWAVSGGENPYGVNSLYAREPDLSYTWTFKPQLGGTYDVYLWWTEFSSRGTAVPVSVTDSQKTTYLFVNQQLNGGQWNWLGTYTMNAGQSYRVQIATMDDNSTASADAVRIVRSD